MAGDILQNTELFVNTNCVTVQYSGLESGLYLGVWEISGCELIKAVQTATIVRQQRSPTENSLGPRHFLLRQKCLGP